MATVLQYVEGLSDRQADDAVRGRIDRKYALGLSLTDPGFDHTVLSKFRSRLVEGKAERLLLDTLLKRLQERDLLKVRGRQRTDSTHVLADVRGLNRLERVGETLRAALNELALMAPDWLQALAPAAWYERYSRRVENYLFRDSSDGRSLGALTPSGLGPKLHPATPLAAELAVSQRQNALLRRRLERAEAIIEVQKKLADLLGIQLAPLAPETGLDNTS
jgi:hypothetical protein